MLFPKFFLSLSIFRVLLRYGANPDLRDEDGKTPLDKARERNDEGHREVASILQSPADWLISEPQETDANKSESPNEGEESKPEGEEEESQEEAIPKGPKGDPEMAPVYVKALLPMFCQTFNSTMIQTVKRASLGLIKKIIHYMTSELLEVCSITFFTFIIEFQDHVSSIGDF